MNHGSAAIITTITITKVMVIAPFSRLNGNGNITVYGYSHGII